MSFFRDTFDWAIKGPRSLIYLGIYVQYIQGRGRARGNTFNRGVEYVSEMKPFRISGWLSLGGGGVFFFSNQMFFALQSMYKYVHSMYGEVDTYQDIHTQSLYLSPILSPMP